MVQIHIEYQHKYNKLYDLLSTKFRRVFLYETFTHLSLTSLNDGRESVVLMKNASDLVTADCSVRAGGPCKPVGSLQWKRKVTRPSSFTMQTYVNSIVLWCLVIVNEHCISCTCLSETGQTAPAWVNPLHQYLGDAHPTHPF